MKTRVFVLPLLSFKIQRCNSSRYPFVFPTNFSTLSKEDNKSLLHWVFLRLRHEEGTWVTYTSLAQTRFCVKFFLDPSRHSTSSKKIFFLIVVGWHVTDDDELWVVSCELWCVVSEFNPFTATISYMSWYGLQSPVKYQSWLKIQPPCHRSTHLFTWRTRRENINMNPATIILFVPLPVNYYLTSIYRWVPVINNCRMGSSKCECITLLFDCFCDSLWRPFVWQESNVSHPV